MFVVYEPVSQTTAQVTGITEMITNKVDVAQIFIDTLLAAKDTSDARTPPISKLRAGDYVAFKLKPVQIRMVMYIRPDPGGYDMFETIDFAP